MSKPITHLKRFLHKQLQSNWAQTQTQMREIKEFICVATFLPLKSWKYMVSFHLMISKVLKQIKQTEGRIDYDLKADFPKKTSGHSTFGRIRRFIMTEPHAAAVKKFKEWAREGSAFV